MSKRKEAQETILNVFNVTIDKIELFATICTNDYYTLIRRSNFTIKTF